MNNILNNWYTSYFDILLWISYKQLECEVYNWYELTKIKYDKCTLLHYIRTQRTYQKPFTQLNERYVGLVSY
ncbi:hypothetical protein NUACC26_086100 [Scytonema sp. NUACC26]